MELKITQTQLLLFVCLFVFLTQTLVVLEFVPLLDSLFSGLRLVVFLLLFVGIYLKRFYITPIEKGLMLYIAFLGSVTLLFSDTITPLIFQSINILILLIFFKFFNIKDILCYSTLILSGIAYANFLLTLVFPDGHFYVEGKSAYLLGYNYNSMGATLLVSMVVNAIYTFRYGKLRINLICLAIVSCITVLFVGSMTSSVGVILLALYLIVARMKTARWALKAFFAGVILFNLGIPFLQMEIDNNYLVWFIEDVLGKDLTFTDRARIWLEAVLMVSDSPWYGYGLRDAAWFEYNFNVLTAHNFILTMLLKGGLILLVIFIGIVWMSVTRANQHKTPEINTLQFGCSSLLLMMSMETYSMVLIFFLVFLNYFSNTLYLDETTDHVCEA